MKARSRAQVGVGILVCLLLAAGAARAGIEVEPYLQDPQPDGMTVLWWTDQSAPDSKVEYGQGKLDKSAAASDEFVPSMKMWRHAAKLGGLAKATSYEYRVRSGPSQSRQYAFKTAGDRTDGLRVAILGDGRTDNDKVIGWHRQVVKAAREKKPDLAFELGDAVYEGYDYCWRDLYRRVLTATDGNDPGSDLGSVVPYHLAVGNHEIYDHGWSGGLDTSMARFRAFTSAPPNGAKDPNWAGRYYAVQYGCATFLVLDVNNTSKPALDNHGKLPAGSTPDWEEGSEQHAWMVRQLEKAKADSAFTFVLMHPAPYTRGIHGTSEANVDYQRGYELRVLDPLFRRYGVAAVLCSHDHLVEHCLTGPVGFEAKMDVTDPANLNWLVQGNSGEGARSPQAGWEKWMSIRGDGAAPFFSTYFYDWEGTDLRSFLLIEIEKQPGGKWKAGFQTVRTDGKAFDTFSLVRPAPTK